MIIQGEADEYGTLKQLQSIINGVKGDSKQLIIPNVKHTPHKEVPELIIDTTAAFIIEKIVNRKPTI